MAYDRYGDDRRDDYRQDRQQGYGRDEDRGAYGQRDYGNQRYNQREQMNRGQGYGRPYGEDRGGQDRDTGYYQGSSFGRDDQRSDRNYGGERGRGGERWAEGERMRGDYGRQPQGYSYDDRGFMARAGDEVRSWFGDDEAERRREYDARMDEQRGGSGWGGSYGDRNEQRGDQGRGHHDSDYHSWRHQQMSALDRDYHEYRQENRAKFESEFSAWRTNRQSQRDLLKKVDEHMEVVGSDGSHVGTVDKIRGDRIILTKNDQDAGGHHHSVPCSWLQSVDGGKVTLSKSSTEAKTAWRDEEQNQSRGAMFGGDDERGEQSDRNAGGARDAQGRVLGRSFSGTY
jgi:hypothetical protein